MRIVFSKDGEAPRHVPTQMAIEFFRAFRAEMWRQGMTRDPKEGDCVLGVRIVSLTA
jgi:hypothetical protein